MNQKTFRLLGAAACSLFAAFNSALAQGTAFTYQGQLLNSGAPASGNYDFTFALFNSNSTNTGQVGTSITNLGVGVTNGLFTVTLDFGGNFPGASRWLAIAARTNGGSGFTALSPLQDLTPTPYAIYTANAGAAATATTANSVAAGNIIGPLLLSQLPSAVVTNTETGVTLGGTFSGNGGGLTNLNASQLSSGVVPNSVLPGFQSSSNYSAINGGQQNTIVLNSDHSVIGGGWSNNIGSNDYEGTIAGGYINNLLSNAAYANIGGGENNTAAGGWAAIGGGNNNTNNGNAGTISGGQNNLAGLGYQPTVGGGYGNIATNNYATVPGGFSNVATGSYSFAAGFNARATNQGAFVWADSQAAPFSSTNTNSFNVRASGGVVFNTGGTGIAVDGVSVLTAAPGSIQGYEINDGGSSAYQTFQQAVQAAGGDISLSFSNLFQVTMVSGTTAFSLTINGSAFGSVIGFSGSDGMSQPYSYVVETQLSSATANPDSELGLTASLTFTRNGRSTVFGGIVTGCTLASSVGSTFLYTVKIESGLAYLALNTGYQLSQNKTAPNAASAEYQNDTPYAAPTMSLSATYSTHGTLAQYAETDLNFFSRILESEGVFYFFNQGASPPSLVLGDNTTAYLTSPNSPFIYYGNTASNIPAGAEYIRTFQKAVHQSTLSSTVNAFDPIFGVAGLSKSDSGTEGIGNYFEFGNDVITANYDQQLANVRQDLQTAQRATLSGSATAPDLRAGYTFGVTDNSGAGLGGSYLITSLHQAGFVRVTNGVSTYFYGNEFTAIPSSLTFRPPLKSPKPQAQPCYATVIGPAGEEIYVDQYGRVKVSFDWSPSASATTAAWVPVASPWAGNGRGMIFNPRVGDEVLVSFVQGDPDQPIVCGSIYNADDPVPFTLPANETQSGIVTLSSVGGGGFNELRFEDKKGSEEVFLHAQRDLDVQVLNNWDLAVQTNATETVGGNKTVNVTGTSTENVTGNKSINVTGGLSLTSSSQISLSGATTVSGTFTSSVARTGGFGSAAADIENLDASVNCSPALRLIAHGSPAYGALSVSTAGPVSATNSYPIASFGNANVFVSYLDNNGNWYASGSFTGNTFVSLSDRNAKENFQAISPREVLDKVAALPLTRWNYKADKTTAHIGPMAQDFYAAFNLGKDDKHIATVDEEGVALAAIQGLNQKLGEKEAEIQALKQKNESLEQRLTKLEHLMQLLAQK